MFRSGEFVAEQLGDVDPVQVQPNGVDLRVDTVLEQREPGRITTDGTVIGERQPLHPEERDDPVPEPMSESGDDPTRETPAESAPGPAPDAADRGWDTDRETFYLAPGGYILLYAETVSIPEGHVGFVLPRSSLMRNSCMLNTAVWDAGYTGRGEGLLQVHHDVELERGARVAQLVLGEADHEGLYDGSYQGERLD